MLPIIGSGAFTNVQTIDWRVDWYNSSMTTPEVGIGYRLNFPSTSFTTAGMQAAANPTSYFNTNSSPVLTNSGTWGLNPVMVQYWGTGAPPGIPTARYVVQHWRGFFSSSANRSWAHGLGKTSSMWLAFSGMGFVRVQLNGTDILNTKLNYSTFLASTLITPNQGDQLDVFYWQNGDQWGGITGNYVVQQNGQGSATSNITTQQYRESPPLASSIIPFSTASAFTLPSILDATLEISNPTDTPTLKFSIPLANADASIGWRMLNSPRRLIYADASGTLTTIKRRQLVKFFGGFQNEQYQRFTGHILDFDEQDAIVTVTCVGIEERMAKLNVQNYPDAISYDTFGYFKTLSTSEPIFGITAYDNWPLEHAIKDLAYRAGIDPKLFATTKTVNNLNNTVTNVTDIAGNPQFYYRARRVSGDYLKLQRSALYGNAAAGFSADKPADDTYVYTGNLSHSTLDWARELADAVGYDFRVNALGAMVLNTRNNPNRYLKITGGTQAFSASAIAGTYQSFTTTFNIAQTTTGARFDLVAGIGPGLGSVNYSVSVMSGIQVASGTISLAASTSAFFYDNLYSANGTNLAVFTLFTGAWGNYTVRLSRNAGTCNLDSIFVYDFDTQDNCLPVTLATDVLVESLRTKSNAQESINYSLVIGKRKSTITDSQKDLNPNNPEYEFYVSAGADVSSIYDPNATNFAGGTVAAVIVDDKISDQDYANWVAATLITRQRDPGPSPDISHPVLPFLEPRDPIAISDANYLSITGTNLVWVSRITERYAPDSAVSELTGTAYPQIPSYEPRQDLPVSVIDSTFFGQPVINVNISYPSIDSGTISNIGPGMTNPQVWGYSGQNYILQEARLATFGSDANGTFINMSGTAVWPPVPDSIAIGPDTPTSNVNLRNVDYGIYKNNPYMKFTHIYDYSTKKIHLPCQAGDNNAVYQLGGWGMGTTAHIVYAGLDSTLTPTTVYSGVCPFYDPYTSELPDGNLINITFDNLTSGYYRVSVWDARNKNNPIQVAWLSNPDQDPANPDLHWQYMTAGRTKQFLWDGVDNIGIWNQLQSAAYSQTARGWFEQDQKPEIGKGFYCWNDRTTQVVAISGQMLGGKLVFNPDHYSQFFVKIECMNDAFATAYETGTNLASSIRVTNTNNLQGVSAGQNPNTQEYIYMYLPPPTTINITGVEDWNPLVKAYDFNADPYSTTTGWGVLNNGLGDGGATFRNDKPLRLTFTANYRPGGRFSGNHNFTTFKVNRVVHLNANFMDLITLWEGQPWTSLSPVERKRVLSRRLTNSTNTIVFNDTDFRTGDTLDQAQNKWVFRPQDFQVTVNGTPQALSYCDYLQLEDVPSYSQTRVQGQARSRLIIAYMNYIFYLSAYIQDRSGRMTWALDTTDIDTSKICFNTFTNNHPEDLENYSARTIVTRQWNDPNYINTLSNQWSIGSGVGMNYIQFFHNRLIHNDNNTLLPLRMDTAANIVSGSLPNTGYTDFYTQDFVTRGNPVAGYLPNDWRLSRQLGGFNGSNLLDSGVLGQWSWEGSPGVGGASSNTSLGLSEDILWIPDLTRDFHPYALLPPVATQGWDNRDGTLPNAPANYAGSQGKNIVNKFWYTVTSTDQTQYASLYDQAINDTWFAPTFPPSNTGRYPIGETKRAFWPGPGHTVDEYINANGAYNATGTPMPFDVFNYQRQIERPHWEEYRGFLSTGKFPSQNPIEVVASAGPYLMNSYKYRDISRFNRTQLNSNAGAVFESVDPQYYFIIATQNTTLTGEIDNAEGWWEWTFRAKYTWYSSSYFPCSSGYGDLAPRYLYSKWAVRDWGTPTFYDNGAWVGWKDDHDPNYINNITWTDHVTIDTAHAPLNGVIGIGGTNSVGGGSANNIFLTHNVFTRNGEIPRPPIAVGPKLTASKNVMISLALVNARRSAPVIGK